MEKRKRKNSLFASFTTLLMMLLMVAFGACSTKKSATGDIGALTVKEIKSLPAMQKTGDNLSAKLKLNANIKGKTFSAGGNLKIKRGEGLQISINALGGLIEVARIEMTPEKMLLIYRLGREYAEVRYSEIEAFRSLGLDRHWRNARTLSSHNPRIFKDRVVGDYAVNGTEPPFQWKIGRVPEPGA